MAWHDRKVINNNGQSPRVNIPFFRYDLLLASPDKVINPYTKKEVELPLTLSTGALVGPNIFDVIKKVPIPKKEGESPDAPIEHKLILRPTKEFFENPKKKAGKKTPKTRKDELLSPFTKALSTMGSCIGRQGDFIRVEKRSSVSLSRLVFLLASGMYGSERAAILKIHEIASSAWERDLVRAEKLYSRIKDSDDGVPVNDIESPLEAVSTISQEVEQFVLAEACQWLGVDPNADIVRQRGRPTGSGNKNTDSNSHSGFVLKMTLDDNGTIEGAFIIDFSGFKKRENLKNLDLKALAALLVALQKEEHVTDAELLEAYLEALDPDWREAILSGSDSMNDSSITGHDPYAILGIEKGAGIEEIKKAYRRAIRQVHPDRSGLSNYFAQVVNSAYRTLMEKMKDEQ